MFYAYRFKALISFIIIVLVNSALFPTAASALVVPPAPYDGTDRYALLWMDKDLQIIGVDAKISVPGTGMMFAVMSFRTASGKDRKFRTSVSGPVVAGDQSTPVIGTHFDFSANPIPVDAHHRVLEIYHQPDPEQDPVLIAAFMPEQLIMRPAGNIVFESDETSRDGILVFGPVSVIREREMPKTEELSFSLPDASGMYILRLRNGDLDGGRRVSSAAVMLNGQEVFRPSELSQQVAGLSRQIAPKTGENQLKVNLRSAPGAVVTLEIIRADGNMCRALGPQIFSRSAGKPDEETITFSLNSQLHGPFTLNVFNGNTGGSRRVDSAVITLNGEIVISSKDVNEQIGAVARLVSLQELNSISVELQGAPGDQVMIEITGYDSTPPRVVITSPANGAIVSTSPVTVTGTVDDPFASVTINGVLALVSNGTFTAEGVTLQEGDNTITVTATDSCGNEGRDGILIKLQTIVVKGPDVTLCAERFYEQVPKPPTDSCQLVAPTGSSYGVITALVDDSAAAVTLNGILMPDGVEINEQGDIFWGKREGNFIWAFVTVIGPDGPYPFTLIAANSQDIKTIVTATLIKDTVAPKITVLFPPPDTITSESTIAVSGLVDDPEAAVAAWPGILTVDGISFTIQLPLNEGGNYTYIGASDPARNFSSTRVEVRRDTIAPVLTITKPVEGFMTNKTSVAVTGTLVEQNPLSVTASVNGGTPQLLTVSYGSISGSANVPPGRNTIGFQAIDKIGLASSVVTRTVIVDQDAPSVAITSPLAGAVLTGIATVSASASDALTGVKSVSLLVDGQTRKTLTQAPYNFSIDTWMFSAGTHTITASALDKVNNKSEASIKVTIPKQTGLRISSPSSGTTINNSSVIVKGKIDLVSGREVGITVNGVLAEQQGADFAAVVPLQLGQNTITATATNIYGVQEQDEIIVNTETQQDSIRLYANPASGVVMTKADGSTTFDTNMRADAANADAIVDYSWDINGDGIPDQTGAVLSEITATYSAPGFYYPTVTVTDSAGNIFTETTIVNILDKTTIDTALKAKWNGMKQALILGDIEGALNYFLSDSKTRFRDAFNALNSTISSIASNMQNTELVYVMGPIAKAKIRRDQVVFEQSQTITYYIYYVRDMNGIWRIEDF